MSRAETDPTFTLYWRTGDRETVTGRNVAEAMTLAGYGGGAVRALDFYANGDNAEYDWDKTRHQWNRREVVPPLPANPHKGE